MRALVKKKNTPRRSDREIERVKKDFVEGWISNSRAFNVYGVKLSNNGKVDYIKTKMKRKLLKKANEYEK